ncbi:MAG: imidazoleglycerol-phosphate dehydratase HisB [Lachnospiraceae bacterium]|nr:imidazoleglycerol-phosphate dehydratase HisB [Lachnospiraceae bacterium]
MERKAFVKRVTGETEIVVNINLDGTGKSSINTGIGFFDHMLTALSKHSLIDMEVECKGDLNVDNHHTVEDVGIVIGQAILQAVGDKKSIVRFGNFYLPMDDSLVLCALDLSGRPYYCSDFGFTNEIIGSFEAQLIDEFFYSVSYSAMMNIHFCKMRGKNAHHICEAAFKAFAKALMEAVSINARIEDVLSTKGTL